MSARKKKGKFNYDLQPMKEFQMPHPSTEWASETNKFGSCRYDKLVENLGSGSSSSLVVDIIFSSKFYIYPEYFWTDVQLSL